jgi:hypothetical protein
VEINGNPIGANADFTFGGVFWTEADKPVAAFPGGKLETKWVEGDKDGKVRVRIVSEVTGDKDKGYTYTYTVENTGDKAIHFQWAGWKGDIDPKKAFTKTEHSEKVTEERSEIAKIEFKGEAEVQMKCNLWVRPK